MSAATKNAAVPQVQYFIGESMAEPAAVSVCSGKAIAFARPHRDRKTPNEDSLGVCTSDAGWTVLVLADGAGGLPSGGLASEVAVKAVIDSLVQRDDNNLRAAILDGFEQANRRLLSASPGSGTTLAVAEIRNGVARTYHVGDSVIAVIGSRGRLKHATLAHSPMGYAVESGIIDEESAMHHEERHLVSNLVGDEAMHIALGAPVKLSKLDRVILGSDGLFDNMRLDEIAETIRKGPIRRAGLALGEQCLERMHNPTDGNPSKPDDLSFIIFRG